MRSLGLVKHQDRSAQGVDCVTILGAGSLVICLGYLLMAPAAPFVVAPSLEQIAVGRSHK